jgi:CBS domain-containing protein
MSIGRICSREVDVIEPEESAAAAAVRMRDRRVGTLVVLNTDQLPVGIVTDRDLVTRVMAAGKDPARMKIAEIITRPVETMREDAPIEDVLLRMRGAGIRRMLVVDESGRLAGVVSVDDIVSLLSEEFGRIGHLLDAQASLAKSV